MATAGKNLSEYRAEDIPNGADFNIGIVVSEWNYDITGNLLAGAKKALLDNGVKEENIKIIHTPGTFELPITAQHLFEANQKIEAIVAIGSVIQGETRHFDFVCDAAAQGVKDVSLKYNKPVIFCVLTDNNHQQAVDRSGGKHGNKGIECAIAALKMIEIKRNL